MMGSTFWRARELSLREERKKRRGGGRLGLDTAKVRNQNQNLWFATCPAQESPMILKRLLSKKGDLGGPRSGKAGGRGIVPSSSSSSSSSVWPHVCAPGEGTRRESLSKKKKKSCFVRLLFAALAEFFFSKSLYRFDSITFCGIAA